MTTRARRLWRFFLASFTVALVVAGLTGWLIYERFLKDAEERLFDLTRHHRYAAALERDLAEAAGLAPLLFAKQGTEDPHQDAGAFLNPKLRWQSSDRSLPEPAAAELPLPPSLVERVRGPGRAWAAEVEEVRLNGVDFRWMAALAPYTYWSLERQGPLAEARRAKPGLDPMYEPRPDLSLLAAWVKLRIISVLKGAPAAPAFQEITQLARLALTTERLLPMLAGLSWLEILEDARELLAARGQPLPPGQAPRLERGSLARVQRAVWGQIAYLDLGVPDELTRRIFPEDQPPRPGLCAALNERLPTLHLERALLEPFYPQEFARVGALVARLIPHCRDSAAISMWRENRELPAVLGGSLNALVSVDGEGGGEESDGAPVTWERLRRIPPLRRALGLILVGIAKPDALRAYESGEPAPSPQGSQGAGAP